ncbi:hypothetical protein [Methanoculleus bourgensis]|uniref:Uncharacterized protein n=1 Tax=Methanoculleus bourgensis TaxID=83986 RepID=A0A0X3BLY9_9EURY|nr:hypothetical protein [Methanoculleus bourgensis]CVK33001.1 protein of unknown function [Methanoculleus bourgensis]
MTSRKTYIREVARQLSGFLATGSAEDLIACLVAESNLPGPRANRDLAAAFAAAAREYAAADENDCRALWSLCIELACVSPEDAPAGDPHEFLPLCGVLGIAAIGAVAPAFTGMALAQLQDASLRPPPAGEGGSGARGLRPPRRQAGGDRRRGWRGGLSPDRGSPCGRRPPVSRSPTSRQSRNWPRRRSGCTARS